MARWMNRKRKQRLKYWEKSKEEKQQDSWKEKRGSERKRQKNQDGESQRECEEGVEDNDLSWSSTSQKQQQRSLLRPEEFMDLHHVFLSSLRSFPSSLPGLAGEPSLPAWVAFNWMSYVLSSAFFVLQGSPAALSLVRPDLLLTNEPQYLLTLGSDIFTVSAVLLQS